MSGHLMGLILNQNLSFTGFCAHEVQFPSRIRSSWVELRRGLGMAAVSEADRSRRLLGVHAHPDDESITTGGLFSRCAEAGVVTILLTCTDGRYGPVNPELGLRLPPDQLAGVRSAELDEAARILGVTEVRRLGHHDSNMTGLSQNQAPKAFWAQPTDELVATAVRLIRECRPHVVVTYDAFGNTGHPDHVQAHRITMLAVAAASEARRVDRPSCGWRTGTNGVGAARPAERFLAPPRMPRRFRPSLFCVSRRPLRACNTCSTRRARPTCCTRVSTCPTQCPGRRRGPGWAAR